MRLGIIGFGRRVKHMADEMIRLNEDVKIAAISDVRNEEIKANFDEKYASHGTQFYNTPEEMLADAKLDGVLIGTRCSLHTELACKVLPTNLPLFLEKPVVTSDEQYKILKQAYEASQSKVVVSFPLRVAPITEFVKEIIDSGKLGTIEHVQAINNVPYGSTYYQNWYRDENETQGLFLQKATHDFDYINYLLGFQPVMVSAMHSKQIFKGDKPAGLKCVDCTEKLTCPESSVLKRRKGIWPQGEYCAFAVDTGNEDSGTAIVRYDTGMHVSYSQNFFARRGAQARGARLLGYKGTVEFDFYSETVKVFMHHTARVETYEVSTDGDGHMGGDTVLAQNFIDVVNGKSPSKSTLKAGLLSAQMCLRARESAMTNTFQTIVY